MLTKSPPRNQIDNRWDEAQAAGLSEPELLLYRSNLLGADKRITNYGGGNTSLKVAATDPLTREKVEVLWVKGSGGDLGSIKLDGFATLYMDKLNAMKGLYRGVAHEDEMVGLLPHATFNLNPRAASIDTPLHAFLPYPHVDHVHPDAVIAIAASKNSRQLTREIYGDEIGWLPWKRPGFELGLWLEKFARENPEAKGCVLESHGLFTWAAGRQGLLRADARRDQPRHRLVRAGDRRQAGVRWGGDQRVSGRAPARIAARLMPAIRSLIGEDEPKVGHFDDSDAVLEFVGSKRLDELAALGTSCPDHFLRTKIWPLVLQPDAEGRD